MATKVYKLDPSTKYVKKARSAKEETKAEIADRLIAELYKKSGGADARELLALARQRKNDPKVASLFEWDDKKAGEAHRLAQARGYIQASMYLFQREEQSHEVRMYVSQQRGEPQKDRVEVLSDEEMRARYVEGKLSTLVAWCDSIVDVPELDAIRKAVMRLVDGFRDSEAA